MPDYNSKNIPTLDDIIDDTDDDSTELAEHDDTPDTEHAEAHRPESDEPENDDAIIDDSISDGIGDATNDTRVAQNTHGSEAHQSPPETHSSLQINYQEVYSKQTSLRQEPDSAQEQSSETKKNTPLPLNPVLLEPIVDAVVAQLMPEFEQHLKQSIKQALDDNLPEEITESSGIDDT